MKAKTNKLLAVVLGAGLAMSVAFAIPALTIAGVTQSSSGMTDQSTSTSTTNGNGTTTTNGDGTSNGTTTNGNGTVNGTTGTTTDPGSNTDATTTIDPSSQPGGSENPGTY